MEIEVDSMQPGILVLHEAYYPGWFVEVDGEPARLLRANVLFRGVEVSEGRHNVVFRFAPFSLANLRDAAVGLTARTALAISVIAGTCCRDPAFRKRSSKLR